MIKVLTLREPWASLILYGFKTIETRSWYTSYRGDLYIHAGKHPIDMCDSRAAKVIDYIPTPHDSFGHIILKCTLSDCVRIDEHLAKAIQKSDPVNYCCGDFTTGRYAWILANIQPITPLKATGHLGLWNFDLSRKEDE